MKTFRLIVSSPDGNVFEGEVAELHLRGANGDLAVLSGHIPFITPVKAGVCRIMFVDGEEKTAKIGGGMLTVATDKVTVLSDNFVFDDKTP